MGLSPTAGLTPPGAFPEDGIWGQGKAVGTKTLPTALLFAASFVVRLSLGQSQLRGDNLPLFLKLVSTARILPNVLVSVKLAVVDYLRISAVEQRKPHRISTASGCYATGS